MPTSPLLPTLSLTPGAIRLTGGLARNLLSLGEIIPATLVAALDTRRALIQIKGQQVSAEVPCPLPEGVKFQVRVEQLEPRVVLRLLAQSSPEMAPPAIRLKTYLAGDRPAEAVIQAWQTLSRIAQSDLPEELREAWTGFQENLQRLSGRFASRPDPQAVKDLINLAGLNWENKLQRLALQENQTGHPANLRTAAREDLKGLLLNLKLPLEPIDPDLARAAQPILQKIELCQWLNASDSEKSNLLLFFPWQLPEGPGWAELLISEDRSGREPAGEKAQALLFVLHLPALGKLRIEVTIRGRRLYGRFKTERPEVAELLERQGPRLQDGLQALGYQASLESLVMEEEPGGDPLPVRLENFNDFLISRVV